MSKPRPLRNLLSNGTLERLLDRAHRLAELDQRVRPHLPPSLSIHCRVANVKAGTLILQTDSPAVHAKLRFHLPQLVRTLRQEPGLAELETIEVRVAPRSERPAPAVRTARLSEESAQLLQSSAEAMSDPDLRVALRRLASRRNS